MVSEKKKEMVENIKKYINGHSLIGIVDMHKLPAKQLADIRRKLKDKAIIKMAKKSIIKIAIKKSKKTGMETLEEHIQKQPALLISNSDAFELAKIIAKLKSPALAKPGDISPKDIFINAGPTPLKPGPVIGELQRLKIPVSVEGDKIVVKENTKIIDKGQTITKEQAELLTKLGIEPMEIGLNLLAVYDNGIVYTKDLLFIPQERYIKDLKSAHLNAFNLSLNTGYVTSCTIGVLLSNAHRNALNLALNANIMTKNTVNVILQKAHLHMLSLKKIIAENG